ncbi:MAG: asparagine synthase-related protein [Chloroflexota bacterium]
MSGICGIFSWQNEDENIQNNIARMVNAIRYRGRGGQTLFCDKHIALSHLKTYCVKNRVETAVSISPTWFANPNWHEDQAVSIAIDGAVYNKDDKQIGSGASVATTFAQAKGKFAQQLDGHFSLALWDKQERALWLARDGLGTKPLYYCHLPQEGLTLFASEAKAILAHPAVAPQLDPEALSTFLSFGLVPSPFSIFANIHKVFPGEVIKIDQQGRLEKKRFWAIPAYRPIYNDLATWATTVRDNVIDTVAKHIGHEREFGVFLSGGLDSTLLVAILKLLGVNKIQTFTVDFHPALKRGHQMADLFWARQVAGHYETEHQEFVFTPDHDPQMLLPCIIKQFDEPTITPNAYSKYFLAQMAAQKGIRVCLSGSGSEVNFERPLPKKWGKLQKDVPSGRTEDIVFHLRTRLFTPEVQQKLLCQPVDARAVGLEAVGHYVRSLQTDVPVERVSGTSFRMLIADKGIPVQNQLAAMHGIDIRFPLYDAKLLDFMSHVPNQYKGFGDASLWKAIMLKAFENDLPQGVLEREIIGYPSYYWNNGEVKGMQDRYLSPASLAKTGLFNEAMVKQIMANDAVSQRKSAGKQTWGLFMIQAWHEQYIGRNGG